jgi:hypothetical protein
MAQAGVGDIFVKPYPWIRLAFQTNASPFETAVAVPSPTAVKKPSTGPPTKRPHVAQARGLLFLRQAEGQRDGTPGSPLRGLSRE